ncbi:MAG: DUF3990 domain-containing protein [Christensenellaceae bacterium]|jgi:transcriptional regulator with XRE-family HTH domain|nr:DUF3990 domain-containing protein [Christensenellaceae bacterium]
MKLNGLVKSIRESLRLSQAEFAEKIGVARLAVTRWENENTIPNRLAQRNIYEIVKAEQFDILAYIADCLPKHETVNNKVVLYHGSKSGIAGDIKPISRDRCDFGKGFYMGTQIHQTMTLLYSFEKSVLYALELDLSGLRVLRIATGIDWAMLVAYSRGKLEGCIGTAIYEKYKKMLEGYDVIVGDIANDRMFYVLDRFFMGDITDKGLVESLSALKLGEQYVALTEKACKQIKIIANENISELEKCFFA